MDARVLLAQAPPRPWRIDSDGDLVFGEKPTHVIAYGINECGDDHGPLIVRAVNEYEALLAIADAAKKFVAAEEQARGWRDDYAFPEDEYNELLKSIEATP